MRPFEFVAPETAEKAVAILAELTAVRHGVKIPETVEPPKVNVTAGCEVPQR